MESEGALAHFRRSIEKYNIINKTYICDGDSKSYSVVSKSMPHCPSIFIEKQEYTSHIAKRLGTGSRALVKSCKGQKLSDGKRIGGKRRLKAKRVDTFQNVYGAVIRSNKGNSKAMSKATHVILNYYSNSPENPKHEDCPEDETSWCSYNRDRATDQNTHKPIKNSLSQAVVEKTQPLFNKLGNENFLAACEKCKTQNVNEAYHSAFWMLAHKSQYNSPNEIQFAVYLATLLFNQGTCETFQNVCKESDIPVTTSVINQWKLVDHVRVRNKKCNTS